MSEATPGKVPVSVGPYRIEGRLGVGGMGEVYRAYDRRLGRHVAIKQMLAEEGPDHMTRERFLREARAAATLNHPAIVQIFDVVEDELGDWIVMELVEGFSLAELSQRGRLTLRDVVRVLAEVCEGLAEAHRHGIVHRDLKVENVMVTPPRRHFLGHAAPGRAKILDFGLAKWTEARNLGENASLSATGMVLGTCRAMSPEQAMGLDVDPRSDLFSLGTLLYEALTGVSPFLGKTATMTMARVCSLVQPPVRDLQPAVPREVSELVDRLLAKEVDDRPASAAEVLTALSEMAELPELALPPFVPTQEDGTPTIPHPERSPGDVSPPAGKLWRAAAKTPPAPPQGMDDSNLRRKRRRHRWVLWLSPALVLAALLAAWYFAGPGAAAVASASRPAVAVLGFKNLGEPGAAWLSTALAEMISTELAAGGELRVVAGETVARTRSELELLDAGSLAAETLTSVGRNLASDYVVLGSYLVQDDGAGDARVQLLYSLQETATGVTRVAASEIGTRSQLLELARRCAARLREALGAAAVPRRSARAAEDASPASSEALRLYAEGLAKLRGFDALAARRLLEQAVTAEPSFALGHATLGRAWHALGYDQKAMTSAARALKLATRLRREDYLAIQAFHAETAGDWPQAVKIYQVLWGFFPDETDYGLRLSEALQRSGRARDALVPLKALKELPPPAGDDPRIALAEASVALALSRSGDSLAAVRRAINLGEELGARALVAQARLRYGSALRQIGQHEEARRSYEVALVYFTGVGDRGAAARVLHQMALLAHDGGRRNEAEDLYRQALHVHRETGDKRAVARVLRDLAAALAGRGELGDARAMCVEARTIAHEIHDREGIATAEACVARLEAP